MSEILDKKFTKFVNKIKAEIKKGNDFDYSKEEQNIDSVSLFFSIKNNAIQIKKIQTLLDKICKGKFVHETTILSNSNELKITVKPPNYYNIIIKKQWIYYIILLSLFWILIPYL